MKRILESDKIIPVLLTIISFLLALLSFFGKKQVDAVESIGTQFSKFQIETVKNNSRMDKTIQLMQQRQNDIYQQELHPTTLRSQKNEKDIIRIKSDVKTIKSIIK